MQSVVKFSEDIISLGNLKINPGRVVSQLDTTHRPVLLTNRGRGVAVIQSLQDFEAKTEEREFMKAVLQGFADVEEGRTTCLADAKKRLGLA
jgi:prevent-host-death family protein